MYSLVQTSEGGIAFSGNLTDTIAGSHAFIAKLDSMGDVEWTKYYNDSLSCSTGVYTLVQTFDGGFAFSGWHDTPSYQSLALVKTDSLGNPTCPGSDIPGFQFNFIVSADSLITLNSQLLWLPDSTVISNFNNLSYSQESYCFAPINTTIVETNYVPLVISPNPFHYSATISSNGQLVIGNAQINWY